MDPLITDTYKGEDKAFDSLEKKYNCYIWTHELTMLMQWFFFAYYVNTKNKRVKYIDINQIVLPQYVKIDKLGNFSIT